MNLLLLGVNHRTAAIEDREALALSADDIFDVLSRFQHKGLLREAVVLSTCNRTEFYAVATELTAAEQHIRDVVLRLKRRDLLAPGPHRYFRSGSAVAEHLFRVACGLDSMVLGDVQILGQVKDAYVLARQAGSAGPLLERLFETALHAGKRSRSETSIGNGTVSVPSAAVELAIHELGTLAGRTVTVLGAGETASIAARHAAQHRAGMLVVANRTVERAAALAASCGATVVGLEAVPCALAESDVVIAATSAPTPIVSTDVVREATGWREGRPLLVIDIAVPRNVEAAVGDLPGVRLVTIDGIRSVVDQSLAARTAQVPAVEAIVLEEAMRFQHWMRSLGATPVIVALRDHFERIRIEELQRLPGDATAAERERADRLTQQLVNRLLHAPMLQIKAADPSSSDGQWRLQAVRELFELHSPALSARRHDA